MVKRPKSVSSTLRLLALVLVGLGLLIGLGVFSWFDHRHITTSEGAFMMRTTTLGEPHLGERVGGLILLGFVFKASVLAWSGHVLRQR